MRLLWRLFFFCLAASLARGAVGEARLTSSPVVEVTPGKIVTASILVLNTGDADAVYDEDFRLPAGWHRVSPPRGPIELGPGAQELRLLAFLVPAVSPADSFNIDYALTDARTRAPVATTDLTVVVLPVGKLELVREDQTETIVAGESCAPRLRLINRGNSRLKVALSAHASSSIPVRLDAAEVWIEPAASHVIRAYFETDVELSQPLTQVVRFKAAATGADGAKINASRAVAVNIIPRVSGESDPYVRLPARLRMTAVAEDGRASAQGEFSGDGFVDEQRKQRVDFLFRGPTLESESVFGLRDEYRVGYYGPALDLHVGDRNYSLSPLTQRFNYGRGAAVDYHPGPTGAGAFFMETLGRTRDFRTAGAYVSHKYGPVFSLRANALHKSEPGLVASPALDSIGLLSLEPGFDFGERLNLQLEYGMNPARTGPEAGAHRVRADGKVLDGVTYSLERVKAGDEFFGYYHATESTQAALTFPIRGPLRGKASLNQSARDAYADSFAARASPQAVYASRQTAYRPGLLLRVSPRTDLSLEHQHVERESTSKTGARSSVEDSARLGVGHSRGKLSVQNFADFGVIRKDAPASPDPADASETVMRFSSFVSYRPDTKQAYSIYGTVGSSSSGDVDPTERSQTLGLSAQWTIGSRLEAGLNYARNHYDSRIARVQDTAGGTISYTLRNRHVAALQTRWRNDSGSGDSATSVTFSYTIPFGLPVSKKKGGGMLRGQVFEQVNGVSHPISRVILTANGITAVTDRKGCFVFPSLRPGRYQVNIEQGSLGAGRVTVEPVPIVVEVEKDATVELAVGIADASRVRARLALFGAAHRAFPRDGTGSRDAETDLKPLGGLASGLVELANGKEVLRLVADADGTVSFDNLRPGKWTLRVYQNNLPPHHVIETPETTVEVEPGQSREVLIRILPVRRAIRMIDGGTISSIR